ncbi:MAG: acetyl/propionyl/methylcrotonyl-CoA carboxylase subunit alpha [Acidimicrobiales bacterium]
MGAIRRLLVANRGEIARRIIRAAHEMGIGTVAVYAEGDAGAPFVAEAGSAVALTGRSAGETYLNQVALLEAARRTGADAIHPGYGFLSENALFAAAVREAGYIFVGPPSRVIKLLGDKIEAKRQMSEAGVPVLGSAVMTSEEADAGISAVYPLMVKAAAGGGGRGMRVVTDADDLAQALVSARREAKGAFGDDRVFVEPYLQRARHVEIQIFGDSSGNLVHCFERECSIQRRHQKLIEESPSPAVTPKLREQMGAAALRAARAVGYENAGTVEFLLGDDGRFFFLEVNTRLQVEHPVTEAVTGLDLVREQMLVAMGEQLSFTQDDISLRGHAIEARLYAEDVEQGFLPAAGSVAVWQPADDPAVRYDSGIEQGTEVGIEFDPMLAKVVAHGSNRSEAASRLARALERTSIHGITTNREFLIAILRHEAFLAGDTPTTFLTDHAIAGRIAVSSGQLRTAAVIAALSEAQDGRDQASVLQTLPSGWRMSVMPAERRRYLSDRGALSVEYRVTRDARFEADVRCETDPSDLSSHRAICHGGTKAAPDVAVDMMRQKVRVTRQGRQLWIDFDTGESVGLQALPRFPERDRSPASGALVAPMPGTVLAVHAAVGDAIEKGQLLLVVEAMKMEHRITAPFAGAVREVAAVVGQQVASGDLLVSVDSVDEPGGE